MTPPEQQWDFFQRATVRQDMEFAKIPVSAFVDQIAEPTDVELTTFYDRYKNLAPTARGRITRTEGWTEPVELMTPEPAFAVPRRIKLAYVTARLPDYQPTEKEIAAYYEKHKNDYPNPAFSRPLEENPIPNPRTPGGPAVAQKPKRESHVPAWAEKPELLPFDRAKDKVKRDLIFDVHEKAREINDKRITQALAKMNELSSAYQAVGKNHKTPQEISDELKAFAKKEGLEYTVPASAWTPKEMTAAKVGQAVEVDIHSNPLPGQLRASVRPGGACVVYLAFEASNPEDLYRPTQVIVPKEIDTRYVYWKIEDLPPKSPEWGKLEKDRRQAVIDAWKIQQAARSPRNGRLPFGML